MVCWSHVASREVGRDQFRLWLVLQVFGLRECQIGIPLLIIAEIYIMSHGIWGLIHWHLEARTNGWLFADNIFVCILLNENIGISIKIALNFVPKCELWSLQCSKFRPVPWSDTDSFSGGMRTFSEFPHQFIFNSLAPGKFEWNFRLVIFKQILVIDVWGISCEIALIWMTLDFTDDQSTLVQVMAWCHQATSHYLSQCWPRSLSPSGVTRPQWVKLVLRLATYLV